MQDGVSPGRNTVGSPWITWLSPDRTNSCPPGRLAQPVGPFVQLLTGLGLTFLPPIRISITMPGHFQTHWSNHSAQLTSYNYHSYVGHRLFGELFSSSFTGYSPPDSDRWVPLKIKQPESSEASQSSQGDSVSILTSCCHQQAPT